MPILDFPSAADLRREFVCDVESVGDAVATLKYLRRCVFRTAITNDRIESMSNGKIPFRNCQPQASRLQNDGNLAQKALDSSPASHANRPPGLPACTKCGTMEF
ncbi:MAG: transposase [Planctomycetaceae bacterium]